MFVLVHSNFDHHNRQTDRVFFSRPVVEVSLRDDLISFFLQLPVFWFAKIVFKYWQDFRHGEVLGLIELPYLDPSEKKDVPSLWCE